MSITSPAIKIDSSGKPTGEFMLGIRRRNMTSLVSRAKHGCWAVIGCSHAWHRRVFEFFGPLQPHVFEDRAIEFRSWALGTIVEIKEPLVLYRVHGANMAALRKEASTIEAQQMRLKMLKARFPMFEQYRADLHVMLAKGLGNAREISRAERWIDRNLLLTRIEESYWANPTAPKFWQVVCINAAYKPREALRWIRRKLGF
jgi:hypothetical protein